MSKELLLATLLLCSLPLLGHNLQKTVITNTGPALLWVYHPETDVLEHRTIAILTAGATSTINPQDNRDIYVSSTWNGISLFKKLLERGKINITSHAGYDAREVRIEKQEG